ncbi:ATP-binding protein [Pseudomonas aeruginosa]|uniref:ATP-binding protein n=1 Tax=Pseudomonas aeruginosa TaxID=287 RepID=UPI0021AECB0D|nr:ATP-binding protein [Pseudomonas aeruginosa]HCF1731313.1 ATP-binding protein [Pseudomonas aeruginosa]HCF4385543.1 ATP-binding protein [Pseudomonas aeruginosa]
MLANIKGLVERLELSPAKAMMPLFEAISNSIDAIEEHDDGFYKHKILIQLTVSHDLAYQAGDRTLSIDGFDITDDGVGFNDVNMASFEEAHTLSKVKLGGKGVGRFTYLKVFSHVHLRSVFSRKSETFLREFEFSFAKDMEGAREVRPTNEPLGTKLSVRGMADKYRPGWPSDPSVVAERILAHFLIRFAARSCPPMTLECPGHLPIDLHQLFNTTVQSHINECFFTVLGHEFALQAYRHHDGRARHDLHLCANGREVTTSKLREVLPELPERLLDEAQEPYTLIVLVTGEYLDAHANTERTKIAFQSDEELDIDTTLVPRATLNRGIAEALRPLLANDLKSTNEEKIAQVERFVEQAPEYRVLTHDRYRHLIEQRVQPGLKDEQLDHALLQIRREVEDAMRKEERHVAALIERESFDQYQERIRQLMEDINDVGKAKLADYIAHRRTILDLIDQSLKRVQTDSKYPFERVLHKMIFPMGVTSREIFLDQQNLWMIDERLCFHTVLTSDKKLNKVSGLESTSGKEPDVFAFFYDTPIGVSEPDNLPGGGVVIVEFKRPGRDDYDKDPADQIIQRFWEIDQGNVKDIDGRPINPERLRYTGYLIADLTPTLRRQVAMRYHRTADNEGYFSTLPEGNGYIEIISYDKLVRDAKRRNRVLFDKLGLHKH